MAVQRAAGRRAGRTRRGEDTRRRLIDAGEDVFGRVGYYESSIAEITRHAGVAMGTFYLYFASKKELFTALVRERGHEMRHAIAAATATAQRRSERERAGFEAFMRWIAGHRRLYRIVRQAEYVDEATFEQWYRSIAAGYTAQLSTAIDAGEVEPVADVETLAFCLMGIGDFVGMRWLLLEGEEEVPPEAFDTMIDVVWRALGSQDGTGTVAARRRGGRRPAGS